MTLLIALALGFAGPTPAVIPFELAHDVILIKPFIGKAGPLEMALDSGTVRTTMDEAAAKAAGLDLSMKARSSGAHGTQEISVLKDQTLPLAGFEVTEPLVLAYPLEFLSRKLEHRVDSIVGVELFRKYVIEIDYADRSVRVMDPDPRAAVSKRDAALQE